MSEPQPPRLHEFSSLNDAAAWLTYWDDETWTPEAVISRLYAEWIQSENGVFSVSPETIAVVVPGGTKLTNLTDGTAELLQRARKLYVAGVEQFLRELHECGEAVPTALVTGRLNSPRWRIDRSLSLTNVRLSQKQIEVLQKPFSDLIRQIALGHVASIGAVAPKTHESGSQTTRLAPVPRHRAQDATILAVLREMGHDPLALTRNQPGKKGIPSMLRSKLVKERPDLFSKNGTQFTHAWERLAQRGEIGYLD